MKIHILFTVYMYVLPLSSPDLTPPPGTMRISKNLYIDKSPITYLDYYEYLNHLTLSAPHEYHRMVPADTTLGYRGTNLWRNKDFHDSPIVGLTMYQMQSYCVWRSDVVNQLIFDPGLRCSDDSYWATFDDRDPEKKYKVVYSIPESKDISNIKLNRSSFAEQLADGIWSKNRRSNKPQNNNFIAFRCKATYVPVE